MKKFNDYPRLIGFIVISQVAGVIGSLFTTPSIPTWYAGLVRPSFAPPNWVFGPVWATLFLLMGIASYIVWRKGFADKNAEPDKRTAAKKALVVFAVQLALNILWSALFFGARNLGLAFIEVIIFWIAILATIIAFRKVSKQAAYLLIPYIVWVTFAAILNYAYFHLN